MPTDLHRNQVRVKRNTILEAISQTMHKPWMNPSLLVSPVADGYSVFDPEQNRMHELNPAAALLLELCDGHRTVDEIAEIASEVMPDNVDETVAAWLVEAEHARLVIDHSVVSQSAPPVMSAAELTSRAGKLRDDGLIQAAYLCQEHAVRLNPHDADGLRELGELAHILGRREAAHEAYERYAALVPDDAEVRHILTSFRDDEVPQRVPDECIRQLYHRFASFYESNMCGELCYQGPQHLTAVIDDVLGDRGDLSVLDLGCGTGLAGSAISHRAQRLVGVDLSPEMVEQAWTLGIYDELHVAEVTQWLSDFTETFDLIMACDTLIYFGDLAPVLRLASLRLADGGAVAFSVERSESGAHQLTDNGRYQHHPSHIEQAARQCGLQIGRGQDAFIRMEYGHPVDGIYVCMTQSKAEPGSGRLAKDGSLWRTTHREDRAGRTTATFIGSQ